MAGRRHLDLSDVKIAVLDEVDRMFDIGFREDIKKILRMCPEERQTIFVSATITDEIEKLVRKHMRDPEKLVVTGGSLTVEMVKQHHVITPPWDKRRMLMHLIKTQDPHLALVFCRMKRTVDDLVAYFERKGVPAEAIHGDMSQGRRNRVMKDLKEGRLRVLLASDLASRGIDVDDISHVFNYDLPEDPDLYVHRIGRTARAGREGVAFSIVTPEQGRLLTDIEKLINAEVYPFEPEGFEFRDRPANWKDEPKPNQAVVEGVEERKSRYDNSGVMSDVQKLTDDEKASKFPGGVVPKKMPRRQLGGRVRTGRR